MRIKILDLEPNQVKKIKEMCNWVFPDYNVKEEYSQKGNFTIYHTTKKGKVQWIHWMELCFIHIVNTLSEKRKKYGKMIKTSIPDYGFVLLHAWINRNEHPVDILYEDYLKIITNNQEVENTVNNQFIN